jgi:hypothetical protein
MSTGKKYVTAIVDQGTGWVTIRQFPGTVFNPSLTFPQKSFVTFQLNGNRFYTNNSVVALGANSFFLQGGYLSKTGDTVRCTWFDKDGVDLIQEVYPVLLDHSEQIIFRWKVYNKTATPITAAVQYLLDVDVNGNDSAPILTRYGYRPIWDMFSASSAPGVPWFYVAFENALPTVNPGIMATGYTDNTLFNLGLTKPWRISTVDWNSNQVAVLWGPQTPFPSGSSIADAAVLLEFNPIACLSKTTAEIARTSYGSTEFDYCTGQLFGVIFYPHRIRWVPPNLVPNPFNVDLYAFNPTRAVATNVSFSLDVGQYLTITAPPPVTNNGKSQSQIIPGDGGPGALLPLGYGLSSWSVDVQKETDCKSDLLSTLFFHGNATGVGTPVFIGGGNTSDTCDHPIVIECANEDLLPPIVNKFDRPDTFTVTFGVHDDRVKDKGMRTIIWKPEPNTDSTHFVIGYTPSILPCDKIVHAITAIQKDSAIGGCFDFTFEDCAGNTSDTTVCFSAHAVPAHPDTLPPIIRYVERLHKDDSLSPDCNYQFDSLIATDSRPYDRGLLSVYMTGTPVNMQLRSLPIDPSMPSARFAVMVIDSMLDGFITVRAEDVVHNISDSTYYYCTIHDTLPPLIHIDRIKRGYWHVSVRDNRPWDRHIDSVMVLNRQNITFPPSGFEPNRSQTYDSTVFEFYVSSIDTLLPSSFCIKVSDIAGNISDSVCESEQVDPDIWQPNISAAPAFSTNPTRITVSVDDIHLTSGGDTIGWDKGIDTVWFTDVRGIVLPSLSIKDCPKVILPFELSVEDTLDVDSSACVTIWAKDCAGNIAPPLTWCYPYQPDIKPPFIKGRYDSRTHLVFDVYDSALYDRGLHTIELAGETNLTPPIDIDLNRAGVKEGITLDRDVNTSSFGTMQTLDYWGSKIPLEKEQHTASIDFGVWVQDLAMTPGVLIEKSGSFSLPIMLVKTDTFSLARKGIREFEFAFAINGNSNVLLFKKPDVTGMLADGWNVTYSQTGNTYHIHGVSNSAALSDPAGSYSTPLLNLSFSVTKTEVMSDIDLTIGGTRGETILYNGGNDTILSGQNAIAHMPAPYGILTGTKIIITGNCTPVLAQKNSHPVIVSLEQNRPNPFSGITTFRYTTKEDARVRIGVYDMLGNEVARLFDAVQAQGTYTFNFDGSQYPSGSYIVRLEAGDEIRSCTIFREK